MQFNLTTQVFGVNKVTVDGNTYCSVFTGQPSTDDQVTKGVEVTKLSADPVVFDQLPNGFEAGQDLEFIAILKRAAGGKSQPYLTGIVPPQPSAKAGTSNTGASKAEAK